MRLRRPEGQPSAATSVGDAIDDVAGKPVAGALGAFPESLLRCAVAVDVGRPAGVLVSGNGLAVPGARRRRQKRYERQAQKQNFRESTHDVSPGLRRKPPRAAVSIAACPLRLVNV